MKRVFFASALAAALLLAAPVAAPSSAQEPSFFTIGTGGTAFTYYPVGAMVANAISKPPGSRECGEGGSCGVDGLVASAVSSRGSVDNINAVISGLRDAGFAQSDTAYFAYTATGSEEGKEPAKDLRIISALYDEHVHLVAAAGSDIRSVADLRGKRVSLDEPGSGTRVLAELMLEAAGMSVSDLASAPPLKGRDASDALRNGKIDAFIVVAGAPTGLIVELAETGAISLVPIDGQPADNLTSKYGYYSKSALPAGTYSGFGDVPTVAVGAQFVTSAKADADLIYKITKAMWNKESRVLFDKGHAKGKSITPETALNGVGAVPLHEGAERFYREAGLLK